MYGNTHQMAKLGAEAVKAAAYIRLCEYHELLIHVHASVTTHIYIRVSTQAYTSFNRCIYGDASQIGRRSCEGRCEHDRFEPLIYVHTSVNTHIYEFRHTKIYTSFDRCIYGNASQMVSWGAEPHNRFARSHHFVGIYRQKLSFGRRKWRD